MGFQASFLDLRLMAGKPTVSFGSKASSRASAYSTDALLIISRGAAPPYASNQFMANNEANNLACSLSCSFISF